MGLKLNTEILDYDAHPETQVPADAAAEVDAHALEPHPGQIRALRNRYYGPYANRLRGVRRLAENGTDVAESIRIDEPPDNNRRKANWARLIQKVVSLGHPCMPGDA